MTAIARQLGIRRNLLYKWRDTLVEKGESSFPGSGRKRDYEQENARLKRELAQVKEERKSGGDSALSARVVARTLSSYLAGIALIHLIPTMRLVAMTSACYIICDRCCAKIAAPLIHPEFALAHSVPMALRSPLAAVMYHVFLVWGRAHRVITVVGIDKYYPTAVVLDRKRCLMRSVSPGGHAECGGDH